MIKKEAIIHDLNAIRSKAPLIHNITNYVVMNNTANALLAIGASPVMAHSVNEMEEMVSLASALVLNIGTLSESWIEAMFLAGETAHKKDIPVILDPVGAGATSYRDSVTNEIINRCHPQIIRGNASEILAIANKNISTKGVDSTVESNKALNAAMNLAGRYKCVVVISGEEDYITNGNRVLRVKNGSPLMVKVTGMGCTASAIVGAFAAVNNNYMMAAAHGMAIMGITGELAAHKSKGPGSLQMNFIDTLYNLSISEIEKIFLEF